MLVSDLMVNSMLKNTQRYFCDVHRMLNEDVQREERKKKNDSFCTSGVGLF